MKDKKNIVWVLLAIALISFAFKNKTKRGSVSVEPVDKGEFPTPGTDSFPSDVPDYQN